MKTISITVYRYDELTQSGAKARARDYLVNQALDHRWYDTVFNDVDELAKRLGISIDRTQQNTRTSRGGDPDIRFRGFSCQGDGASFTGTFCADGQAGQRVREWAPKDETLHTIADAIDALAAEDPRTLHAKIERHSHHYSKRPICAVLDSLRLE